MPDTTLPPIPAWVLEDDYTLERRLKRVHALRRQAVQDGMRPLRLAGALRVAEGVTTLQEVMASTPLLG